MSNNHLIVGLGGTGGKVVRALRKIVKTHTDENGVSPSEANFEYVYLDTALLHKSAPGQTSPTPGVATPQPPSADSPTL
ncbi:UNVERIFIED_CONTAM: tubulin-like doman-containing protein [Comamonas sp. A-3]